MSDVAYRRVSTGDQSTLRQLEGMEFRKEFSDKQSGKDTKRPGLAECLRYLREGDCLHVHSIDRLARSLADLERIVTDLTSKGISIKFHKEGLHFNGKNSAMDKLLFQMLSAFAEFERSLIRERTAEGIRAARKKGVRFGPPDKLSPEQLKELKKRKTAGESAIALAEEFGISRSGVYKMTTR